MIMSLIYRWFFNKNIKTILVSPTQKTNLVVLSAEGRKGRILYEDGWVRVTPAFIEIGREKKIVVGKIREMRRGSVWSDGLCGLISRTLLTLFISGMVIFGLCESWLWFALCLVCGVMTLLECYFRPHYLSIHMGPGMGEYLLFSDSRTRGICESAIEEAIQESCQ